MSSTRLLVLGIVRIFQPVHGYDVRRELQSWRVDDATNSKPGSVYSALKTLEKDGLIAVSGRARGAGLPERTEYVLTSEGQKEFEVLLRSSWWTVESPTEPLIPALCLMTFLSRDELAAALNARAGQLEAKVEQTRFSRAAIRDGATGAEGDVPEHVREILDFLSARTKSELEWTRAFSKRLRDGVYSFAGERPEPKPEGKPTTSRSRSTGQA